MSASAPDERDREVARRESILAAAQAAFAAYGYRRTSLEDVARGAGISRTGLYHHFAGKEELFRAACEALQERALAAAEAAALAPGSLAERLSAVLEAKHGPFFDVLHTGPHGSELLDEGSRLCGESMAAAGRRYQRLLARLLRAADLAGELDLERAGLSPDAAAELLHACVRGLEGSPAARPTPAQYRRRLAQLVRVFVAGLGGRVAPAS